MTYLVQRLRLRRASARRARGERGVAMVEMASVAPLLALIVGSSVEFGRDIVFQKTAGPASVVIFDGGHEGLPDPACEWLSEQSRLITASTGH